MGALADEPGGRDGVRMTLLTITDILATVCAVLAVVLAFAVAWTWGREA